MWVNLSPKSERCEHFSFPGSAWECRALQAPPALGEAEPCVQCVPRRSLGTSLCRVFVAQYAAARCANPPEFARHCIIALGHLPPSASLQSGYEQH